MCLKFHTHDIAYCNLFTRYYVSEICIISLCYKRVIKNFTAKIPVKYKNISYSRLYNNFALGQLFLANRRVSYFRDKKKYSIVLT